MASELRMQGSLVVFYCFKVRCLCSQVFNYWLLLVMVGTLQEEILQRELNAEKQHRVNNKAKKNQSLDHSSKKKKKEKKKKKTKKS
jgi:sortase (surface protein transpeptidase)